MATSFESQPREVAVDLLILASEDQRKRLVATVEAQLRVDPIKRFRMLEYVAAARRDHHCVGLQIMFSPDPEVIEKTRASFEEEPHFCPILLGPTNIPKLVDVEAARARPVLATLSAIVHAHAHEGPAIIEALVHGWHARDDHAWHADARILWSCIPEDIMNQINIPMALDRFQSDEVLDDDDDGTTEPSKWERGTVAAGDARGPRTGPRRRPPSRALARRAAVVSSMRQSYTRSTRPVTPNSKRGCATASRRCRAAEAIATAHSPSTSTGLPERAQACHLRARSGLTRSGCRPRASRTDSPRRTR